MPPKADKPTKTNKAMTTTPCFDFEQPLVAIQEKIEELKQLGAETGIDVSGQMTTLTRQADKYRKELYSNLKPNEKLQIVRHPERPNTLDIVSGLSPEIWFELHGNRCGMDDGALVGGIIELNNTPMVVVGTQKGHNMKDNLTRNFGMPNPEGYEKAMRLFAHANKFGMPILTLIDTPGAYPGIAAEEHGIGYAIALNIREMARLRVPVVSVVVGEGCSGGALGIGVANHIYMLEHAVYTVISPEGCASILWRDASHAGQAAEALKLTAQDLESFGIIDGIIPEPLGGAHLDVAGQIDAIGRQVAKAVELLKPHPPEALVEQRFQKYRKIGVPGQSMRHVVRQSAQEAQPAMASASKSASTNTANTANATKKSKAPI